MTDAVDALRADSSALLTAARAFSPEQWATPSSCAGWSVQDVVAHMSALWLQLTEPGLLPAADPSGNIERTQDRWVESMRGQSGPEVLAGYEANAPGAIATLETLRGNETPIDLGDLGTHPLGMIANAYSFDHFTHLRADIFGPIGPVGSAPEWDELRLGPAMDWMIAGIPQMCRDALAVIDGPVILDLTGPGGRVTIFPSGTDTADGARVTSSTEDFVRWGTQRCDWRDLDVQLDGDLMRATTFCDAIRIF